MSEARRAVSSTITVRLPRNNPSSESMFMERRVMLLSFEIMEVMLLNLMGEKID